MSNSVEGIEEYYSKYTHLVVIKNRLMVVDASQVEINPDITPRHPLDIKKMLVYVISNMMNDDKDSIKELINQHNTLLNIIPETVSVMNINASNHRGVDLNVTLDGRTFLDVLRKVIQDYILKIVSMKSKHSIEVHEEVDECTDMTYVVGGPIVDLTSTTVKFKADKVDYTVVSEIADTIIHLINVSNTTITKTTFTKLKDRLDNNYKQILCIKVDDVNIVCYKMLSISIIRILDLVVDRVTTELINLNLRHKKEYSYVANVSRYGDN